MMKLTEASSINQGIRQTSIILETLKSISIKKKNSFDRLIKQRNCTYMGSSVTKRTEWSVPRQEVHGSNPYVDRLYWDNFLL